MELSLIEKAVRVATVAHKDQLRKSDKSPYIVHPFMTAIKLIKYNFSETVVAASLTHDILEDTNFTEDELRKELGDDVVDIVVSVSEDKSLDWLERKKQYLNSIKKGSEGIKAVSIVDKIHNAESLLNAYSQQGLDLWGKFSKSRDEKLWFENEVLRVYKETWDHPLVAEYESLVNKMNKLK